MTGNPLAWLAVLLALAPAALVAGSPAGPTGILTWVEGAVQLAGPGVEEAPLARVWQVVSAGVTFRVPAGGAAGIVCFNHRFVRLEGPVTWSLTEAACAAGKELTPGELALVAPRTGRFKVIRGLLTLEREIREVDGKDPLAPVVVSPCNTTVRAPRPAVTWSQVPLAIEYLVEWNGRGTTGYDTQLHADHVACSVETGGPATCVLPWPPDRPDLLPGATFFVRIGARTSIADPWRWSETVTVRTLRPAMRQALEARLASLEGLGLEGAALNAARAGLLAGEDHYAEAAEAYRRALATAPSAELGVTLADVYLVVGLHHLAAAHYREAVEDDAPAARAAASFGLGRVEYARARYREAAAAFRQAREGYAALNLGDEEAAAREAAEKAADLEAGSPVKVKPGPPTRSAPAISRKLSNTRLG